VEGIRRGDRARIEQRTVLAVANDAVADLDPEAVSVRVAAEAARKHATLLDLD
jgi:hypothetical protein